MTKDKTDVVLCAQIGQPVPAKHTFDTDSDVVQIRENQVKKHLGVGFDVLMHLYFVFSVNDANVHFTGMQIDPAVVLMLLFVKSHRLASFRFGKFLLWETILYRCE
jgi:hypothetical protein